MSKYQCPICDEEISGKNNLIEHVQDHYEESAEDMYRAEDALKDLGVEL